MRIAHASLLSLLAVSLAAAPVLAGTPPAKAPAPGTASLYQRIGGEAALKVVVDDFLKAAMADPKVNFARSGQWHAGSAAMSNLKKQLVDFLGQAFGGPQKYDGGTMKEIHEGMAITQAEFDALAGHLKATLEKHKVGKKEVDEIMAIAGPLARDIVEKK